MREDPMCGIMQARSPLGNLLVLLENWSSEAILVRDQGVGGSNPLSPTNSNQQLASSQSVGEIRGLPKRTYIGCGATGCAKNSRHTVAAAILTASTLSSRHVRL